MNKEIKNRWISPSELEKEYGLTKGLQAKLRMKGKIPYSKIGSKIVKYDRIKIDQWLEDAEVL